MCSLRGVLRVSATLSCPMTLHKFPLDTQTCPMMFESCECCVVYSTTDCPLYSHNVYYGLFTPPTRTRHNSLKLGRYETKLSCRRCEQAIRRSSRRPQALRLAQVCSIFFSTANLEAHWTELDQALRERGRNFELYEHNYKFFRQSFVVNCLLKFLQQVQVAVLSCDFLINFFVSLQITF